MPHVIPTLPAIRPCFAVLIFFLPLSPAFDPAADFVLSPLGLRWVWELAKATNTNPEIQGTGG